MFHAGRLAFAAVAFAAFTLPASAADAPAVKLKKGDKIVFLGDSITQGGEGKSGYITVFRKALEDHHKDLGIEVVNAGISGNRVPDLQKRLQKDVLDKKPTIVVIYIGINDVWHGEKDAAKGTSPEKFEEGLKEVIKKITDAGARVVLCTPSVIGEKADGGNPLDKKLDEYADISRKVAKELKLPVCDLRKAFLAHLKDHNTFNKEKGVLTTDGVHLNAAGNRFVAEQVLAMFGD